MALDPRTFLEANIDDPDVVEGLLSDIAYDDAPVASLKYGAVLKHNEAMSFAPAPAIIPDAFSLGNALSQDYGSALQQNINRARELSYRRPGETNVHQRYLMTLEDAYYETRGQIPVDWIARHFSEEDLGILFSDQQDVYDTMVALKNTGDWQMVLQQQREFDNGLRDYETTRLMETLRLNSEQAAEELGLLRDIDEQYNDAVMEILTQDPWYQARWLVQHGARGDWTLSRPKARGFSDEPDEAWLQENTWNLLNELKDENGHTNFAELERRVREMAIKVIRDPLDEQLRRVPGIEGGVKFLPHEIAGDFADFLGKGSTSRTVLEGGNTSLLGYAQGGVNRTFGVIGSALIGGVNAAVWAVDALPGTLMDEEDRLNFKRGFEHLFGGSRTVDTRNQMKKALEEQLGMTDREFMLQAGFGPLQQMWDEMSREEQEVRLLMAGGDADLAFGMFAEDVSSAPQWDAYLKEQRALYDRQAQAALEQLSDENYSVSDVVLDLISIWGEGAETTGVMLTQGGKSLFEQLGVFDGEGLSGYWDQVKGNDTVSEVLGIEGTLLGLSADILVPALVDPMTWIFGPRLAGKGRAGAANPAAAQRAAYSPASRAVHEGLVKLIYGGNHHRGIITYLDSYASTGYDTAMMAAAGGYKNVLPANARHYLLNDSIGRNVVDIDVARAVTLVDDTPIETTVQAIQRHAEMINREGLTAQNVPVVRYNPVTGRASYIKNYWVVNALEELGYETVPTRIIVDNAHGVKLVAPTAESVMAKIAPEGKMSLEELSSLKQFDYTAPGTLADDTAKLNDMREFMERVGEDEALAHMAKGGEMGPTPIELYYLPDKAQLLLADGNHRLGALETLHPPAKTRMFDVKVTVVEGPDLAMMRGLLDNPVKPNQLAPVIRRDLMGEVIDEAIPRVNGWKYSHEVGEVNGNKIVALKDRYRDADFDQMAKIEYEHIMAGGDPVNATKTLVSIQAGMAFRDGLRRFGVNEWVDRWFTPINNSIHLYFTNANSRGVQHQLMARLWGGVNDLDSLNYWGQRFQRIGQRQFAMKQQVTAAAEEARQISLKIDQLRGELKGMEHGFATDLEAMKANPALAKDLNRKRGIQSKLKELELELRGKQADQEVLAKEFNSHVESSKMWDEMLTEYNMKHIATNPKFAQYVDEAGFVPWDVLAGLTPDARGSVQKILHRVQVGGMSVEDAVRAELSYVPRSIVKKIEAELKKQPGYKPIIPGKDVAQTFEQAMHSLSNPTSYTLPVSPLNLLAATVADPKTVNALLQRQWYQHIKNIAHTFHMYWMIDKVMTPRTALVVSADELVRIWQAGGAEAFVHWLGDKAAQSANAAGKLKIKVKGSSKWQRRLADLEEYPVFFRQIERGMLETGGVGLDEITFVRRGDNTEFYEAAQRTAGQQLNEIHMQKFFEGKAAFKEWFETSPEAHRLRTMQYYDLESKTMKVNPSWSEIYDGIQNVYVDGYFLRGIKAEKKAEALGHWVEAAKRSAEKGGVKGGPVALPKWVLEGFESVTGSKRISSNAINALIVDPVSSKLFDAPMAYRRGYLSRLVRESEMARIKQLYDAAGVTIIDDAAYQAMIYKNFPGIANNISANQMDNLIHMMRERYGVVSQRHINQIVEGKVIAEMENMLYAFHMSSRMGRKAKAVFPFGKPWADMWGYWGRELLSRPQLRGWLNNENMAGVSRIANQLVDMAPFNPKTAAFVSRLAATDFGLENIEEDPILGGVFDKLGFRDADLGGMLFLPTGGENPFAVMIPGLGLIPVGMMMMAFMATKPDPIGDPVGFQQTIEMFAQFLPQLRYNLPQGLRDAPLATVVGGGVISRFVQGVESVATMAFPQAFFAPGTISGDWKLGLTYLRSVQLNLGQPGGIEQLLNEFDELGDDFNEIAIDAFIHELTQGVVSGSVKGFGGDMLVENLASIMVPARVKTFDITQDFADVWLNYYDMGLFPELSLERFDLSTDDGKDQAGAAIRGAFYDLPDNEQEILLVQNPGLAVNMVSMWRKSDLGVATLGPEPYKSGGSEENLARHESYIQMGYIRPKTVREFLVEVLGVALNAKQNLARSVYRDTAERVNDERWAWVQTTEEWPQVQNNLRAAIQYNERHNLFPWTDERTIWANYNKVKDMIVHNEELRFAAANPEQYAAMDAKQREDARDAFRKKVGIPGKTLAWGNELPSSMEALRDHLEFEYRIPEHLITEDIRRRADALGLEIETGQAYSVLVQDLFDIRANQYLENPLYTAIAGEYNALRANRSSAQQEFTKAVGTAIDHSDVPAEQRHIWKRATAWLDEALWLKSNSDVRDLSWMDLRNEALTLLGRMHEDPTLRRLNLPLLYNKAYGRSLGDWDWLPDAPAPVMVDGGLSPLAQQVYIRRVVDGDTIDISTTGRGRLFGIGPTTYPDANRIRLLGINARERGDEGGQEDWDRLRNAIETAMDEGKPFYIVRDPDRYGNTDRFGRQFSWLYIGDEPYYFPETMFPQR